MSLDQLHRGNSVNGDTLTAKFLFSYSNPFVQTQLLTYGTLPSLLPLLSLSQPELLQRRATFALSAILRDHPLAISTFLQLDGLQLLSNGAQQRSVAVLTKLVVILTDLLLMKVGIIVLFIVCLFLITYTERIGD